MWVALGCVSAATALGLVLPGGAPADPVLAGDDSSGVAPSDADAAIASGPGPFSGGTVAPRTGSFADDGPPPSGPTAGPAAGTRVRRHRQRPAPALQPPAQAPVRTTRAKAHTRSGAS
jgi:hypothetical protein